MDVLLVRPPEPHISRFYSRGESLGLGYLAAALRCYGFGVEILDCMLLGWDQRRAVEEIGKRGFAILGLSVFAVAMEEAAQLAVLLRKAGCDAHMTLGGHFPSFRAREILEECRQFNSVVQFEGEHSIVELAQAIRDRRDWSSVSGLAVRDGAAVRVNPPRAPILSLDSLPFPSRDMLPHALHWERDAYVCTSRGCWATCSYCSISPFYRKAGAPPWRARSPENVVAELEYLVRTFNPPGVGVVDADFVGPGQRGRSRALAIADEIIRRGLEVRLGIYTRVDEVDRELLKKLRVAGLTTVYLGIESGVQSALDRWHKHTSVDQNYRALEICSQLGIHVEAGFMLYDPYTTLDEIQQNLTFLEATGVFDFPCLLARMEVRAGMPMEEQLARQGRLKGHYRNWGYDMLDARAEIFHKGISWVLEPLAPVYLKFRDVRHLRGVSNGTVVLAQERINRRALWIAQQFAGIIATAAPGDGNAIGDASVRLQEESRQEAHCLWRVAEFLEQSSDQRVCSEADGGGISVV